MTKLLICDKDGTLVRPASGATFVQHPQDQALIEGVAETIDRYHREGWSIVIASNQGGCDLSIVLGRKVPVGAYLHLDGQDYKITGIRKDENMDDPMLHFQLDRERGNGKQYYSAYPDSREAIRYKTIEDAIEEMRYCLELLPQVRCAYFCPDLEGQKCVMASRFTMLEVGAGYSGWNYRKPKSGMILFAQCDLLDFEKGSPILFVGDRPEDQQAAEAANVQFMWAEDWRVIK